ncbi:MAG: carbonate dehydratase [Pyrinomonadaceae bacterium]
MKSLPELFESNRRWAEALRLQNPSFFSELSRQQAPDYLWIGCSDSRVPATQLVGLQPGEMFVHRNVANVVVHTDLNCLSVLQFAVEVLQVRHVIVCGHYGCGGVQAALRGTRLGLIDNWLRHVQDVMQRHTRLLERIDDEKGRGDRLCELNVIEQVFNVGQTTVVESAWERGQELTLHGWVYSLENGLLHDLAMAAASRRELYDCYRAAIPLTY